jgi:hypothetical protein
MTSERKLELEVLYTYPRVEMVMIVGRLITGDIYGIGKDIPEFRCIETTGRWKLAALSISKLEESTRFIGIEHIEGSQDLEPGFTLVIEEI